MFRESRRLRRARKRLAFAVMLLSLSSCSAPEPPPPLPPLPPEGDVALSAETVVGCYHVIRTEWAAAYRRPFDNETPPDSFQLSADTVRGPEARQKVLLTGRLAASPYGGGWSSWAMTGPEELNVTFSTGFGGVELVLHQRARDRSFYGRVWVFSDGGSPGPLPQGAVLLERVPC